MGACSSASKAPYPGFVPRAATVEIYSTFACFSAVRRMGLTVLPLDINVSDWGYTGKDQILRVGFMQVKGLSREFVERILAEHTTGGPFQSFWDFLGRLRYEPAHVRLLIKAGCFDSIVGEVTRPGFLWRLYASNTNRGVNRIRRPSSLEYERNFLGSGTLPFASISSRSIPIPTDNSQTQKSQHEIELFGFPLNVQPLELYASSFETLKCVPACKMDQHVGKMIRMVGWLITEKTTSARDGEPMEFITLEDLIGLYAATLFPKTFRVYCHLLSTDWPYLLEGILEEEFGAVTLTVYKLVLIRAIQQKRFSARSRLPIGRKEEAPSP